MTRLTSYETHRLIKQAIPTARTVYEIENKNQITIEEWLDIQQMEGLCLTRSRMELFGFGIKTNGG